MDCHEAVNLSLPSIFFTITFKCKAMARNYIEQFACPSSDYFYVCRRLCLFLQVFVPDRGAWKHGFLGNHIRVLNKSKRMLLFFLHQPKEKER